MPAASVLPPASCVLNPQESLFSFLISEIIVSGMLSRGSIVDCGAHKGGEACLFNVVSVTEPQGSSDPVCQLWPRGGGGRHVLSSDRRGLVVAAVTPWEPLLFTLRYQPELDEIDADDGSRLRL